MTIIVLLAKPDENTAEENNRPTSTVNIDTQHHQTGWREQHAAQEDA